jgi:ABC-2 type transport system ATP-binding protein
MADFAWSAEIERELAELPGVRSFEHRGSQFTLVSDDSDATLRSLLSAYQDVHDIEVTSHTMDDAFLALTEGRSEFASEAGATADPTTATAATTSSTASTPSTASTATTLEGARS